MHHEAVFAQYLYERIASWHAACLFEQLLDDQVQFGASKTRIILPVVLGFLDYKGLYRVLGKVVLDQFQVYARFILLDSITGYRSQYHEYATLIRATEGTATGPVSQED